MDNYKLKFENGRKCTIECDSTKSFQDKINDAETRFNSECIEINDKPIKKHSVGGFLVGATIGAILGNSVPAKTISKTASGVKKTAKNVTRNVKKQVKKFSGGGKTSGLKVTLQEQLCLNGHTITGDYYIQSERKDNKGKTIYVVLDKEDGKTYECEIPTSRIMEAKNKFSGGGTTNDERYCRLADDTGKGVNEGFVVGMGETIYESEDNLVKHLRSLDYEDADGNSSKKIKAKDDLLEFFYNDEYYYWTEWDCDSEIEDQGYYYTRDGKEIEIA